MESRQALQIRPANEVRKSLGDRKFALTSKEITAPSFGKTRKIRKLGTDGTFPAIRYKAERSSSTVSEASRRMLFPLARHTVI